MAASPETCRFLSPLPFGSFAPKCILLQLCDPEDSTGDGSTEKIPRHNNLSCSLSRETIQEFSAGKSAI